MDPQKVDTASAPMFYKNIAGPDFENIEETAAKLGFKSIRLVRQMLMKWRSALEEEEIQILSELYRGFIKPNEEDPFYNLILSPKMDECEGPFLEKIMYVLVLIHLM